MSYNKIELLYNVSDFKKTKYLGKKFVSSMYELEEYNKLDKHFQLFFPERLSNGRYVSVFDSWMEYKLLDDNKCDNGNWDYAEPLKYKVIHNNYDFANKKLFEFKCALLNQNNRYVVVPLVDNLGVPNAISLTEDYNVCSDVFNLKLIGKIKSTTGELGVQYIRRFYNVVDKYKDFYLVSALGGTIISKDENVHGSGRLLTDYHENIPKKVRKHLKKLLCVNADLEV